MSSSVNHSTLAWFQRGNSAEQMHPVAFSVIHFLSYFTKVLWRVSAVPHLKRYLAIELQGTISKACVLGMTEASKDWWALEDSTCIESIFQKKFHLSIVSS